MLQAVMKIVGPPGDMKNICVSAPKVIIISHQQGSQLEVHLLSVSPL